MNCDRCGKPSIYHSTLIVNGVSQTTHLCRDCAMKEGVFDTPASGNIFDDLFSQFASVFPFEKVENIVCPVCKTSLREFKNTLKLGCPNCYEAFRDAISEMVNKIAPFNMHKTERIMAPKPKAQLSNQDKILQLREDMKKAVAEERYEDAAKIKKQIKKLENANE